MSTRQVLSANLKTLMGHRPELDTLKKITAASSGRLSNGKLDRIRRATHATDVDTLGELARVFKMDTWQLLVPNLNPQAPPVLAGSELLNTIKALVLSQTPEAAIDRSQVQRDSLSEKSPGTGTRKPPARFPGEVLSTGRGKGKQGEVNQPAAVPPARGRKRT